MLIKRAVKRWLWQFKMSVKGCDTTDTCFLLAVFVFVSGIILLSSRNGRTRNTFEPVYYQNIPECGCTRKFLWPISSSQTRLPSSCSDSGTFYQPSQNTVAFSLHFAKNATNQLKSLYAEGIQLNLLRMRQHYPGYSMRIYTDLQISQEPEYCNLLCQNPDLFWCDISKTPSLGDQSAMFSLTWRFLPLGDPTVDIFLSRDLDSAITPRESAVVQDWLHLKNKKAIHVMRDKKKAHNTAILGGMWGARNLFLGTDAAKLQQQIVQASRAVPGKRSDDQRILAMVLFYPRIRDVVAYDSYHCEMWKLFTMVRPFPRRREVEENGAVRDFVGNVDLGREKHGDIAPCPVECRPSYGKDWEYC